jgi:hypothetical protein
MNASANSAERALPQCAIGGGPQLVTQSRRLDGVGSLSELTFADALAIAKGVDEAIASDLGSSPGRVEAAAPANVLERA